MDSVNHGDVCALKKLVRDEGCENKTCTHVSFLMR